MAAPDTSTPAPLTLWQRLTLAAFPWLAYVGARSYTISAQNTDGTWRLDPAPGTVGLPSLPSVPPWFFQGLTISPFVGALCAVIFLDHDATKPRVIHCAQATPIGMVLDSTGPVAIAESTTDTITIGKACAEVDITNGVSVVVVAPGLEVRRVVRWGDTITISNFATGTDPVTMLPNASGTIAPPTGSGAGAVSRVKA